MLANAIGEPLEKNYIRKYYQIEVRRDYIRDVLRRVVKTCVLKESLLYGLCFSQFILVHSCYKHGTGIWCIFLTIA